RNWVGCDEIYRALQFLCGQDVGDGAYQVVDVNPTPPLPSVADSSADTHTKWREHLGERASMGAQHQANAQIDDPNPRQPCRLRSLFPFAGDLRQEVIPGHAVFGQKLVATVSVVSDRGCR